jgi:hypothetical protein
MHPGHGSREIRVKPDRWLNLEETRQRRLEARWMLAAKVHRRAVLSRAPPSCTSQHSKNTPNLSCSGLEGRATHPVMTNTHHRQGALLRSALCGGRPRDARAPSCRFAHANVGAVPMRTWVAKSMRTWVRRTQGVTAPRVGHDKPLHGGGGGAVSRFIFGGLETRGQTLARGCYASHTARRSITSSSLWRKWEFSTAFVFVPAPSSSPTPRGVQPRKRFAVRTWVRWERQAGRFL